MSDITVHVFAIVAFLVPPAAALFYSHMQTVRALDRRVLALTETMHRVVEERDELRTTLAPLTSMTPTQQREFARRLMSRATVLDVRMPQPLDVPVGPPCEPPKPKGPYR